MTDIELTEEMITIDKTKIYCEHSLNDKPPIILIHGFLASSYSFTKVIPLIAKDFSVLAFDLPGFGKSDKSTSFHYSFKGYSNLVVKIMDHFKMNQAYLAGHSMGGQVSLYTAKNYPERVLKLILLNSSGYMKKPVAKLVTASYLPFFPVFAKRYLKRIGVEKTLQSVLYDDSLINQEMINAYERPLLARDFYKSLTRLVRHREGDLPAEEVRKIKTPALLLWGKQDRITPLKVGKQLAKDLPNATLKVFDETGHLITEERPKEITQEMKEFIQH